MSTQKLNFILDKCRIMVSNATDPVIAAALLPYGYTVERIADGNELYAVTKNSFLEQSKEYTDQYYATSNFVAAFETAKKKFAGYVKIARIAFKDNIEGQRLLPISVKIQSYTEFKGKATNFYSVIQQTPQLMELLNSFGFTTGQFDDELTNLTNLEELSQLQFIETGEAQVATQTRNKNLEELMEFCSALRTVAKIALADQPQQLEKLGILARSVPPSPAPAEEPAPAPNN